MGTIWPKSGSIEFDNSGLQADGAIANFYVGGTGTTPLTVYQDAGESTVHAADVEADANGRWPSVFIPYCDSYDVKVTTEGGTQLYFYQSIPNLDPVDAAADVATADELIATGHVHWEPIDGTKTGFVRLNGRTIGNAASGATERANADTSDLFTYLWNNLADGQAAVSTGRGASAAADYAANKTIALPDGRATFLAGLDDMGNSAASRFPAAVPTTSGDGATPGSVIGLNTHTLQISELAAHTHSDGTLAAASSGSHSHGAGSLAADSSGAHTHSTNSVTSHTHNYTDASDKNATAITSVSGGVSTAGFWRNSTTNATSDGTNHTHGTSSDGAHVHTISGSTSTDGAHTHDVTGATGSAGSDTAHNNVPRVLIGTWFMKL